MRKYSIYANGFILARQDSFSSSSISKRFENALVVVNYSNSPHSQDYLAPEKQKMCMQGHGSSNLYLGLFGCSLMFAGLPNNFPLLTMVIIILASENG